jgi:hypothetical protein
MKTEQQKFMQLTATRRDALIICVAGCAVLLYVVVGGGGFALDDSWIHQTFGRNLAWYGEWSLIVGKPSAASTSPLYTVLLALGYGLNVPYGLWTHALGALGLACTGLLGARLSLYLLPNRQDVALLTGVALTLTWHLVWAGASGMETGIFAMLTLWLIFLAWRETSALHQPQYVAIRGLVLGVSVAITTLARPEGIVLGALVGLAIAIFYVRQWRILFLLGGCALIAFLVAIAPYLWLNLQLTGGLLPNTAAAKFEQHAVFLGIPLWERLWNLFIAIMTGGQFFLVIPIGFFVMCQVRQEKRAILLYLLPLLWVVGLLLLYALRLPAWYQHGRYVIPALPAWVLMGVIGLVILLDKTKQHLLGRVLSRSLALATLVTGIFFFAISGLMAYQADVAVINEEMVKTALWIKDNLPPDELLAIHDIGAVGYFAPRPDLLDIAGLINPEIVAIVADGNALWAFLQARDARYLMAFPDQIPNDNPNDSRLCLVYSTNSPTSPRIGGANMAVYRLVWDETCE